MQESKPFYGKIWTKEDIDFQNDGFRESILNVHNDFTDNLGGVIRGLNVTIAGDGSTIIVSPGIFISSGEYNTINSNGGGERAEIYRQISFTDLPETPPEQNIPTYLLVYAKVKESNVNPDPVSIQRATTSSNIDSKENIPTRFYNKAEIIISNPITKDNITNINGVPLALVQVNYYGIDKLYDNSPATITYIDNSILRHYVVGNTVDLYNNQLYADGVKDSFITTRMIANKTLTSDKLEKNSIYSKVVAPWDGITAYNSVSGNGIANQHLKNGAVTSEKINYDNGLNNFNLINILLNSSFENVDPIISGTVNGNTFPTNWDCFYTPGITNVTIVDKQNDVTASKFGDRGILLQGGAIGVPTVAQYVGISQTINFEEDLTNKPISAFFWAQQKNVSIAASGDTGLQGQIEFLYNGTLVQGPHIFQASPASGDTSYTQWSFDSAQIYKNIISPSNQIRYTIGGNFAQSYYIDGAFLGMSDIIPAWQVNPSENPLLDGQVETRHIREANGNIYSGSGYGIITEQFRDLSVTNPKILGPIDSDKINPNFNHNIVISGNLYVSGTIINPDLGLVAKPGETLKVTYIPFTNVVSVKYNTPPSAVTIASCTYTPKGSRSRILIEYDCSMKIDLDISNSLISKIIVDGSVLSTKNYNLESIGGLRSPSSYVNVSTINAPNNNSWLFYRPYARRYPTQLFPLKAQYFNFTKNTIRIDVTVEAFLLGKGIFNKNYAGMTITEIAL